MNAKRNRDRGKRTEREIARIFNGKRLGLLGSDDVQAGPWSIEVKSRVAFAGTSFMDQAVRNAPEGKTPLVVVHITGRRYGDDLVMIRMNDWREWFGNLTV